MFRCAICGQHYHEKYEREECEYGHNEARRRSGLTHHAEGKTKREEVRAKPLWFDG